MTRTLALIDGEHYAPVVRDALRELPHDVVGAVLVGGTEKLRGDDDYGVPLHRELDTALDALDPGLVLDLSDEPVLSPPARLLLASRVLARGIPYEGPGFRFDPPELEPAPLPALVVLGTGKRVGKTAVTGYLARLLSQERRLVVVSMGRGGPAEPQLLRVCPTVDDLLVLSRAGEHAASDYLETAALADVPTVGCRRCGGGLGGVVATSNVAAGVELAASLDPELLLVDGSGAAVPPVEASRLLVARSDVDAMSYLNPYRVLISDVVVLTGDGDPGPIRALKDVPVVRVDLRLAPQRPLAGRRVAVFTTGPAPVEHLDADVVLVSRNLADRPALRADLEGLDAEVYVVEIKAAAIDVVAEAAAERGAEVVFAANDVVPRPGEPDLDALVRELTTPRAEAVLT
jgi:cyclic 2,3-diphosphoglycerate synthetase